MALEATHIRFALEFAEQLQVVDMKRYVSGTIYPDSRYITGIDRALTHPKDYMQGEFFKTDDFRKGWRMHLLCDDVQYQTHSEWFPNVVAGAPGEKSDVWVKRSALKSLQDLSDLRDGNIATHLELLNYTETPNGEDEAKMKEYNAIFMRAYADPINAGIAQEAEIWRQMGIGDELMQNIHKECELYESSPEAMEKVSKMYEEMIRRARPLLT